MNLMSRNLLIWAIPDSHDLENATPVDGRRPRGALSAATQAGQAGGPAVCRQVDVNLPAGGDVRRRHVRHKPFKLLAFDRTAPGKRAARQSHQLRANAHDPGGILSHFGTRNPLILANAVSSDLKGATGRASGKAAVSSRPPKTTSTRLFREKKPMKKITIPLNLTDDEANGLAQLVKRLGRRSLGKDDLNLVTPEEADQADAAVIALRDALRDAGYAPR